MSNPIELILDTRERYLIAELEKSFSVNTEQLELGDIIFKKDDEVILTIERKTINDLKASICDGRHREQKARLIGSGKSVNRIMYVIEGELDKPLDTKVSGIPISTLIGSLINTQLRDNIKVYKTNSLFETSEFIKKLWDKLNKDYENYFNDDNEKISSSKYASTLKTSKKSNMTPEVWFISQLSLIPQVTETIANEVVQKYGNMYLLMQEYDKTPEHLKPKLLSDITYPIAKGNKVRRVGDKISQRIYSFLYNINE